MIGAKFAIVDSLTFKQIPREGLYCNLFNIDDLLDTIKNTIRNEDLELCEGISLDDPIMIGYTSGSTGQPKIIEISHGYILGALNIGSDYFIGDFDGETKFVYCAETTFNHVVDFSYFLMIALADCEIVLYQYENSSQLAKYISDYKVSYS